MVVPANILGATPTSLGALLVGIGALLLLISLTGTSWTGTTWGGTLPRPLNRLSSGAEVAGSIFVAGGSALLLLSASGLSVLAVIASLAVVATLVYAVMVLRLREHMNLVAKTSNVSRKSWWWCVLHPLWRPPS
jgi:hypothetical protein